MILSWVFGFIKNSGIVILCLFVAFIVYMYVNQNGIIYPTELNGMKVPDDNPFPYRSPENMGLAYKNVIIPTQDKLNLHGWLVYSDSNEKKTMIYFHENAGNIGFRLPFIETVVKLFGMNCLIVGYRGYGKSQGTPSESGLKLDGEAIAEWAFDTKNEIVNSFIDQKNIFLFGRSLGGAVAVHVAVKCNLPFKGVIIENTFSSMSDMVNSLYPFLKYLQKFMLKNKWDTKDIIDKITYPILFCRSENDELISKNQMDLLVQKATKTKFVDYYVIRRGTHNEGFRCDPQGYTKAIIDFVKKCNDEDITKDSLNKIQSDKKND